MSIEQATICTGASSIEPAHRFSAVPDELPDAFLIELLLRHLSHMGELRLFELSKRLGLRPIRISPLLLHMRALLMVEVTRHGETEGDVSYALTDIGRKNADLAFQKCQYVGPAPVTLQQYVSQVGRQSRRLQPTTQRQLKEAMGNMVVDADLLSTLGSALNSGKAIYLYGASGSGKSYLAEHLVKTLQGNVLVPQAIYVEGEIIQVFDPQVHHVVEPTGQQRNLSLDAIPDGRWVRVSRPVVVTGGELTLQMLDLEFDKLSRLYVAPPQLKANNGILIIDDLGRQRVSARDLLNRWIVPLDRQVDYLGLHTGTTFEVPFDVTVIFASNLTPAELIDPAFARRLGYKIEIAALSEQGYRTVIAQACERVGIEADAAAIDHMIYWLHPSYEQDYLPCVPYDVISKVRDRALYLGQTPRLTPELIEWAWKTYFGATNVPPSKLQTHGAEECEK